MSDPVRTPWWQQSWLLAVLAAAGLVVVVLNLWMQNWLGLGSSVLVLIALVCLGGSFRQQRRARSVEQHPGD